MANGYASARADSEEERAAKLARSRNSLNTRGSTNRENQRQAPQRASGAMKGGLDPLSRLGNAASRSGAVNKKGLLGANLALGQNRRQAGKRSIEQLGRKYAAQGAGLAVAAFTGTGPVGKYITEKIVGNKYVFWGLIILLLFLSLAPLLLFVATIIILFSLCDLGDPSLAGLCPSAGTAGAAFVRGSSAAAGAAGSPFSRAAAAIVGLFF